MSYSYLTLKPVIISLKTPPFKPQICKNSIFIHGINICSKLFPSI